MLPTKPEGKLRIAVIGCGRIAKNHFGAIKAHQDNIELVACCDNKQDRLDAAVSEYGGTGYLRLEEMLKNESLDLAVLCTPSGLHSQQAITLAHAGVNVITEKPMATRWADGLAMVKACDEQQVRLFVVKQNRRNSTLQLLKRAMQDKRFGKIHLVHLNVFWTRPQEYYNTDKWRGTWELDGGAFMNQASHYIDLLDWMVGPIDSVHAITSTHRDIEVEDTGVMNVRWRNGAIGSVAVTMCTYPKNLEGSITILGEKGTAKIGGVAVNEIQEWTFEDERDYDNNVSNANYETTSVYGFGHPLYYENVVNTMRGTADPETDGREGLKSLEVLIAAYLSARDGKMVSLPLEY